MSQKTIPKKYVFKSTQKTDNEISFKELNRLIVAPTQGLFKLNKTGSSRNKRDGNL